MSKTTHNVVNFQSCCASDIRFWTGSSNAADAELYAKKTANTFLLPKPHRHRRNSHHRIRWQYQHFKKCSANKISYNRYIALKYLNQYKGSYRCKIQLHKTRKFLIPIQPDKPYKMIPIGLSLRHQVVPVGNTKKWGRAEHQILGVNT